MIKGYYITVGNKGFFIQTEAQKKTKQIVQSMIQQIAIHRGLCQGWIERCMQDKECIDRTRHDMAPATISRVTTESGYQYYSIKGNGFTENLPEEDYHNDIIVFA